MNSPPLKSCALSHLPIPEGCEFLAVGLIQTNQNEWQPCSIPSKEAALDPLYASFCKAAYIRKDIWDAWLSFPDVDPAQALAQVADFCSYMALEDREGRFRSWYEGPGKDSPLKDALLSQYNENGYLFDEMQILLYGDGDGEGDLSVEYVSGFVQLQAMSMLMQTTRRLWTPSVEESSHYESGYQFFNVHIEMLMHTVHAAYKDVFKEIPSPSEAAYQEMSDMKKWGDYVPAPDKILRIDQRLRKCTIGHKFNDPFEGIFQQAQILINEKDYSGTRKVLDLLVRLCGLYDRRLMSLVEAWGRLEERN